MTKSIYLYQELAEFVTKLVDEGTLVAGERVPSIREISKQRSVSLSTALLAYRLLEDRGVLEAKPKSGFYVSNNSSISLEKPRLTRPLQIATEVEESSIMLELIEYASDPRIIPLGCAIPSAELLSASRLDKYLARAARTRGIESNVYTVPKGELKLRQEISRRALRWGQGLSPEDIAITCGCTEALTLALKVVTKPGDTIAIESPTFFGLLQIIKSLNLKALELPTYSNTGIDLNSLDNSLSKHNVAACLFSSSFNNPLGCTMPEEKKRKTLEILIKHKVPLIEDDIYGDIYFGESRPKPFIALKSEADILYCSSFSKTVAPGYRIGWIVPGSRMSQVLLNKFSSTLCGPTLPQIAMADFLGEGGYDNHLRRIRRIFKNNIDRMTRTIDRTFPKGTRVSRPEGGFVLWLELPEPLNTKNLFKEVLDQGVSFAPGEVFFASHSQQNCLRLSAGHFWDESIESGIIKLASIIEHAVESNLKLD